MNSSKHTALLFAQQRCAPTKMAAPVGAQLRWAMGLVQRLSRSKAALLQQTRILVAATLPDHKSRHECSIAPALDA
jgi:hypothetical protein